ncbi:DEKNAAC100714 [Brettanomyces naardenensis]|uniref:tRNA (guanine(37)-N1)-methyltransferase n=1 Tax=Brettanomyces naardenensis TaxID=13370 RepID=A0A448YFE2_BRENA|nr:DEKNAAC100714 [Brettanomyces naardenensis]
MSTTSLESISPPICRGSKELDTSAFTLKKSIWTVLLKDPKNIGLFLASYRKEALSIPRIPFIECLDKEEVPSKLLEEPGMRNRSLKAIILNDKLTVTDKDRIDSAASINYRPEMLHDVLSKECIECIDRLGGIYRIHQLVFNYDFWKAEEILKSILPDDLQGDIPTSFTKTGHLAHLNLKDEYKPYDALIGQVILDKNPSITTVVDKVNSIETKYRTFKMKVIAGDPNFMVTQRESDCEFTFDFSKVYWNSRLSTEHARLIDGFRKGSAVCDAMAGVGPFVIPAGKKGCIAFANDLNPEACKYLKQNIEKNKVGKVVTPFMLDGAEFIKQSPKLLMNYAREHTSVRVTAHPTGHSKRRKIEEIRIPHFFSDYAMNLPGSAITFVSAYIGLLSHAFPSLTKEQIKALPDYTLPIIHVYHFEKFSPTEDPEPTEDELHRRVHKKIIEQLNYKIPFERLSFHTVRKVAPTKPMFCISFELPEEVAFAK